MSSDQPNGLGTWDANSSDDHINHRPGFTDREDLDDCLAWQVQMYHRAKRVYEPYLLVS